MRFFESSAVSICALVLAAGCATTESLKPGTGGTNFTVSDKAYGEIWKAAVTVTSRQLTIVSAERDKGIIKAEKAAGVASWGEVVGVYILPPDEKAKSFTVEVQSLKRSKGQVTGQDWEPTIVTGIKAELGQK